jgi:regulator of sigma E protease
MLNILISIIGVILTILFVVGFHEFGHFIVARMLGIKVLRFSIGFGKSLYTCHDKRGTEYVLAAIPLGGYVKMLDEGEGHVDPSELKYAYNRQPYYKKMAVIIAGPIFNLILALFIYWIIFMAGFTSLAPVLGKITPGSIAAQAGLKSKQEIIQIDQDKVTSWISVVVNLLMHAGDKGPMQMVVKNPGTAALQTYQLNLNTWELSDLKPDPLKSLGIEPYEPDVPPVLGNITADSPAAKSGLQTNDKILQVDGKAVKDWFAFVEITATHPDKMLQFTIERDHKTLTLPVKIGVKESLFIHKTGYLGITPAFKYPENMLHKNKYGPIGALVHAGRDVKIFTQMNYIILMKMITGKISVESLGGPITIFNSAGSALNNGLLSFMSFLAFLSISIGIINIVPIPGLDGGHLLFQTIEVIIRRPIPERTLLIFYRMGMIFLLLIMVQALVNDVLRL